MCVFWTRLRTENRSKTTNAKEGITCWNRNSPGWCHFSKYSIPTWGRMRKNLYLCNSLDSFSWWHPRRLESISDECIFDRHGRQMCSSIIWWTLQWLSNGILCVTLINTSRHRTFLLISRKSDWLFVQNCWRLKRKLMVSPLLEGNTGWVRQDTHDRVLRHTENLWNKSNSSPYALIEHI